MKISHIASALEQWAPPSLAESYDNVGLLVGDPQATCTGILVNLDVTEALIDEAVERGANMVVTHHPIWFTGRKRMTGEDYVSRIIIKAIKSDVALYAIHTNLDNVRHGVNEMIGQKLGATSMRILSPKRDLLIRLTAVVAAAQAGAVQEALADQGQGLHLQPANADKAQLSLSIPAYAKGDVLGVIRKVTGEMPHDWYTHPVGEAEKAIGSGMIGELAAPMDKAAFLAHVKTAFGCGGIRYADFPGETIRRVAWCGGAGSFLTGAAIRAGADAFVTGDITYHKYFDNEDRILLMDIGHYESEQFTSELIANQLSKKFPTFAVHLSRIKTNPVKYY